MSASFAGAPPPVVVLVNTCLRYYDTTVPPLLASLIGVGGVPAEAIRVVVGESDADAGASTSAGAAMRADGVAVTAVPYANMDNNALIWAACDADEATLPADAWVFYLHDTCEVREGFWARVVAKAAELAAGGVVRAARIHTPFSMCIGLYAVATLRTAAIRGDLRAKVNLDRSPAAILRVKQNLGELEDYVFKRIADHWTSRAVWVYPNKSEVIRTDARPYGTDTPRVYEYYSDPGVVKIKANWNQGPVHTRL